MTDIHKLWRQPVAAYQTECICQTGVKQETVNEFYNSERIPYCPRFKCFLRCLAEKVQVLVGITGKVNVNRWSEGFVHLPPRLAKKCSRFAEPALCQKHERKDTGPQFQTMTDIHVLWRQPVAAYQTECMFQTGVKQGVVDEFYKHGKMPDCPCFKCFIHCLAWKVDAFTSTTADANVKHWSELFAYLDLPLAEKCSKVDEPDPCEKSYLMVNNTSHIAKIECDGCSMSVQLSYTLYIPIRSVLLLHDNARSRTKASTQQKLIDIHWKTLAHPPYSPDLSPWDSTCLGRSRKLLVESSS
ncbi:hypothetical protein ILUMI_13478 [Ignelater luminosus]|uniref:Uncharacterized protein n=1 Tax=Ignelater luminosus TaxID=2038154 RepID=A0A8K0G5S6_IGNLU|nr:hypothetical protein ILUMI_13478 [Ignelater luminosus]